jgi:hypothetical protein
VLKQIVAIAFALLISGQAFVRTFWAIDYQWHTAIYLKNCENKSKPEMECDGKCYLKKRMTGNDAKDPKAPVLPEAFRQLKEVLLFFEYAPRLPKLVTISNTAPDFPSMEALLPMPHLMRVFRPPLHAEM